jgi:hypothetical protein
MFSQVPKATVQYYEKALYGKVVSAKEAVLIALDAERAKALATDTIFNMKNGENDWLNCASKCAGDRAAIRKNGQ